MRWVRRRQEAELLPPWWFGLSYYDFYEDTQFWHPIPLNYAIKGMRALSHWWAKVRGRRSWFDRALSQAVLRGHALGRVEATISMRKELYKVAIDVVGPERAKTLFPEIP